jgi:hypothetical protein
MRDIKYSKIAKHYQFSKWFQNVEGWLCFMWLIILIGLTIITMGNKTVCVIAILCHLVLLMSFFFVPEYKSIEDCEKQISIKAHRRYERKNKKWLI